MRRILGGVLVLSTVLMGTALTAAAQPPTATGTKVSATADQGPAHKKAARHTADNLFRRARKTSHGTPGKATTSSTSSHKTGQ